MKELNEYQLKIVQQNLKYIYQLIQKNQKQLQNAQTDFEKDFLPQQIRCLKINAKRLQQTLQKKQVLDKNN